MPIVGSVASGSISSFGRSIVDYGGSAYFVGGNQYLVVNNSGSPFEYGTGPWTIEMWYYPVVTLAGSRVLWSQQFSDKRFWLYSYNGQMVWKVFNNPSIVTTLSLTLNAWNHIAFVRDTATSTATFYINGVNAGSTSSTGNYVTNQYGPIIGQLAGSAGAYPALGLITNLRVAKSAIYTSNFTPSRVPFTRTSQNATSVQLLLNQRTAANLLTDSSANNITILNSSPATTWSSDDPYSVPYSTPPAVVITSATVTPSTLTPNEGDTITYTVAGTNTANGTYYYTIEPGTGSEASLTTADFSSGSLSGSFTITGNAGSFTTTLTKDLLTDAGEVFSVFIRTTSITGTIIGISSEITISDTSITPTLTSASTIAEGSALTFTASNVGPDGTYYWTVLNSTSVNADFSATSGSFTVSGHTGSIDNGTGTFTVTPIKDLSTEGSETFQVQVRSGSTSGTVVVTSSSVTITDISLTPTVTSSGTLNETGSLTFTATNVGADGTYYWTILNGTTTNADFAATSGSFTVSGSTGGIENGSGTFAVTGVIDYTTEGSETFQVQVRSGSIAGTVIATSASTTLADLSTTVTASGSPTSVNEGSSITITASGTAFPAGTYYWTILAGTAGLADFAVTSGSFSVASNTGNFTVTPKTADGAEPAETFQVQIRTGSTSGTVIATTGTLTINASAT